MSFRELLKECVEGEETQLLEATFSEKNVEKVVKLYSKIMGRKLGGDLRPIGFEEYRRKTGAGKGFRMMNDKGVQLRFNWDVKLGKKTNNTLTSIDYWSPKNTNLQKPTRTVMFKVDLNVVQILDSLTKALMTGTLNEAQQEIESAPALFEALNEKSSTTREERDAWAEANGLPKSYAHSENMLRKNAEKRGLSEAIEVFLGQAEKNSFEAGLKKSEKLLKKQVYANPETVFDDIEDVLSVVASKQWRTLIVCGAGGVGKCLQGEQKVNIKGL